MAQTERRTGILIAFALAAVTFVAAAMTIHDNYAYLHGDSVADQLSLPRSSLVLAMGPAAAVLYFALIDVMLPIGHGWIETITRLATRNRSR